MTTIMSQKIFSENETSIDDLVQLGKKYESLGDDKNMVKYYMLAIENGLINEKIYKKIYNYYHDNQNRYKNSKIKFFNDIYKNNEIILTQFILKYANRSKFCQKKLLTEYLNMFIKIAIKRPFNEHHDICPICIENLAKNNKITFNCDHQYCITCFKSLIGRGNYVCSMCKVDVT